MNNVVAHIPPSSDDRRQIRTHLFVAATLFSDSGSNPVHIRNMSPSGALIEGAMLPDVGMRVSLRRGPLQASGHVAWRAGCRAGVKLDAEIHLPDWMARQATSSHQQYVDALIATVRGQGHAPVTAAPAAASIELSIEAELTQLRLELGELGSKLIADHAVVTAHPEIQTLDIALQRVDRLLGRLRGG